MQPKSLNNHCNMKRYALDQLKAWKDQPNRKPLILQGARQVGKTWLMKQFAKECFEHAVYINFENNQLLEHLFEKDFDTTALTMPPTTAATLPAKKAPSQVAQ